MIGVASFLKITTRTGLVRIGLKDRLDACQKLTSQPDVEKEAKTKLRLLGRGFKGGPLVFDIAAPSRFPSFFSMDWPFD